VEYTCERDHDGAGPHVWQLTLDDVIVTDEADPGVTAELLEPLSTCIGPDDPWLEYGIVEYRFRERYPELFLAHVRDRGHRILGTRTATASSVRIGSALGQLARAGELISRYGPATGAWAPQDLTYWARPPAPATTLTWADWCTQHGRDPMWTDADRDFLAPVSESAPRD
jgi:hypothetical protein